MKKKNLSSLALRKNKVSNLYKLNAFVGGTDTETGSETALNSGPGTSCDACQPTDSCATSLNPTDCQTNDKTRSLRPPSNDGQDCNFIGSLLGC